MAAALAAALLAGLLVLLLNLPGDGPGEDAAESPATTSEAAPTTGEETGPSSSAPEEPEAPASEVVDEPAADPLSAENITAFLESYHQQVIEDPAAAWERTGPTLRSNISREGYIGYWNDFSDVTVSEVQASDGQTQVTGRLTWVRTDGSVESAVRLFTLIERDGQLVLDSELDP
ncbi:hypothetical protein [Blastococcus sp. TF02A-35]|uniref:hypothetical protein n=1 Tax=Blastococcus sp. TF02A-35 TaxID=2559612 RepID=UPI001073E129|nr:hypothetical protein [Blastococcus sp. TF02A_35]TFV45129.1 hypothetical protein E4P43_18035 [Blastococcus sp. TF02A_35]